MSLSLLFTQAIGLYAKETSFWEHRSHAIARMHQGRTPDSPSAAGTPVQMAGAFGAAPDFLPPAGSLSVTKSLPPSMGGFEKLVDGKVPAALRERLAAVPSARVLLQEVRVPSAWKATDPIVVHIQDIHQNVEAQRSIAEVIRALSDHEAARAASRGPSGESPLVVGVEGARGPLDFRLFRTFPDKEWNAQIADFFLDQSLITGVERVGFTAEALPRFWGVEDAPLYLAHVDALKAAAPSRLRATEVLNQYSRRSDELKTDCFSPELKEMDARCRLYRNGKLSLKDYVRFLGSGEKAPRGDMVRRFLRLADIEDSLNLERLKTERKEFSSALAASLPRASLQRLEEAGIAFRAGSLTPADFHQTMAEASRSAGLSMGRWPEWNKYVQYVLFSRDLKPREFLDQMDELEKERWDRLATDARERELVSLTRTLSLCERLVDFSLTPQEWDLYSVQREAAREIPSRLASLGGAPVDGAVDEWAGLLSSFETYNEAGLRRNQSLVENLWGRLETGRAEGSLAVLVAGGFHTEGIVDLLQKKGAACVVLTPVVEKMEGNGTEYLKVFLEEPASLEKMFTGDRITLAPELATAGDSVSPAGAAAAKTVELAYLGLSVSGEVFRKAQGLAGDVLKSASHSGVNEMKAGLTEVLAAWLNHSAANRGGGIRDCEIIQEIHFRMFGGRLQGLEVPIRVTREGDSLPKIMKVSIESVLPSTSREGGSAKNELTAQGETIRAKIGSYRFEIIWDRSRSESVVRFARAVFGYPFRHRMAGFLGLALVGSWIALSHPSVVAGAAVFVGFLIVWAAVDFFSNGSKTFFPKFLKGAISAGLFIWAVHNADMNNDSSAASMSPVPSPISTPAPPAAPKQKPSHKNHASAAPAVPPPSAGGESGNSGGKASSKKPSSRLRPPMEDLFPAPAAPRASVRGGMEVPSSREGSGSLPGANKENRARKEAHDLLQGISPASGWGSFAAGLASAALLASQICLWHFGGNFGKAFLVLANGISLGFSFSGRSGGVLDLFNPVYSTTGLFLFAQAAAVTVARFRASLVRAGWLSGPSREQLKEIRKSLMAALRQHVGKGEDVSLIDNLGDGPIAGVRDGEAGRRMVRADLLALYYCPFRGAIMAHEASHFKSASEITAYARQIRGFFGWRALPKEERRPVGRTTLALAGFLAPMPALPAALAQQSLESLLTTGQALSQLVGKAVEQSRGHGKAARAELAANQAGWRRVQAWLNVFAPFVNVRYRYRTVGEWPGLHDAGKSYSGKVHSIEIEYGAEVSGPAIAGLDRARAEEALAAASKDLSEDEAAMATVQAGAAVVLARWTENRLTGLRKKLEGALSALDNKNVEPDSRDVKTVLVKKKVDQASVRARLDALDAQIALAKGETETYLLLLRRLTGDEAADVQFPEDFSLSAWTRFVGAAVGGPRTGASSAADRAVDAAEAKRGEAAGASLIEVRVAGFSKSNFEFSSSKDYSARDSFAVFGEFNPNLHETHVQVERREAEVDAANMKRNGLRLSDGIHGSGAGRWVAQLLRSEELILPLPPAEARLDDLLSGRPGDVPAEEILNAADGVEAAVRAQGDIYKKAALLSGIAAASPNSGAAAPTAGAPAVGVESFPVVRPGMLRDLMRFAETHSSTIGALEAQARAARSAARGVSGMKFKAGGGVAGDRQFQSGKMSLSNPALFVKGSVSLEDVQAQRAAAEAEAEALEWDLRAEQAALRFRVLNCVVRLRAAGKRVENAREARELLKEAGKGEPSLDGLKEAASKERAAEAEEALGMLELSEAREQFSLLTGQPYSDRSGVEMTDEGLETEISNTLRAEGLNGSLSGAKLSAVEQRVKSAQAKRAAAEDTSRKWTLKSHLGVDAETGKPMGALTLEGDITSPTPDATKVSDAAKALAEAEDALAAARSKASEDAASSAQRAERAEANAAAAAEALQKAEGAWEKIQRGETVEVRPEGKVGFNLAQVPSNNGYHREPSAIEKRQAADRLISARENMAKARSEALLASLEKEALGGAPRAEKGGKSSGGEYRSMVSTVDDFLAAYVDGDAGVRRARAIVAQLSGVAGGYSGVDSVGFVAQHGRGNNAVLPKPDFDVDGDPNGTSEAMLKIPISPKRFTERSRRTARLDQASADAAAEEFRARQEGIALLAKYAYAAAAFDQAAKKGEEVKVRLGKARQSRESAEAAKSASEAKAQAAAEDLAQVQKREKGRRAKDSQERLAAAQEDLKTARQELSEAEDNLSIAERTELLLASIAAEIEGGNSASQGLGHFVVADGLDLARDFMKKNPMDPSKILNALGKASSEFSPEVSRKKARGATVRLDANAANLAAWGFVWRLLDVVQNHGKVPGSDWSSKGRTWALIDVQAKYAPANGSFNAAGLNKDMAEIDVQEALREAALTEATLRTNLKAARAASQAEERRFAEARKAFDDATGLWIDGSLDDYSFVLRQYQAASHARDDAKGKEAAITAQLRQLAEARAALKSQEEERQRLQSEKESREKHGFNILASDAGKWAGFTFILTLLLSGSASLMMGQSFSDAFFHGAYLGFASAAPLILMSLLLPMAKAFGRSLPDLPARGFLSMAVEDEAVPYVQEREGALFINPAVKRFFANMPDGDLLFQFASGTGHEGLHMLGIESHWAVFPLSAVLPGLLPAFLLGLGGLPGWVALAALVPIFLTTWLAGSLVESRVRTRKADRLRKTSLPLNHPLLRLTDRFETDVRAIRDGRVHLNADRMQAAERALAFANMVRTLSRKSSTASTAFDVRTAGFLADELLGVSLEDESGKRREESFRVYAMKVLELSGRLNVDRNDALSFLRWMELGPSVKTALNDSTTAALSKSGRESGEILAELDRSESGMSLSDFFGGKGSQVAGVAPETITLQALDVSDPDEAVKRVAAWILRRASDRAESNALLPLVTNQESLDLDELRGRVRDVLKDNWTDRMEPLLQGVGSVVVTKADLLKYGQSVAPGVEMNRTVLAALLKEKTSGVLNVPPGVLRFQLLTDRFDRFSPEVSEELTLCLLNALGEVVILSKETSRQLMTIIRAGRSA